MRFADIFGKGLVGALTNIDLTDMVMKGGLVGTTTGVNLTDGGLLGSATGMKIPGLRDLVARPGDNSEIQKMPYYFGSKEEIIPLNERSLQPYHKGYDHGRTHGFADFDGNYNPTFGDFTPDEIRRLNKMYPIGNQ